MPCRAAHIAAALLAPAWLAADAPPAMGQEPVQWQQPFQMAQYRDPSAPVMEPPPERFRRRHTPFALPTAPVAAPTRPQATQPTAPRPQAAQPAPESGEQDGEAPAASVSTIPVYSTELLRLSEILGSMHYLRPLCGAEEEQVWRQQMDALLTAEAADGDWRQQLVHSFNQGYHTFERSYRQCTPAATLLVQRYMAEGEKITQTIKTRYAD